jgi:hypothetical protein
MIDNNILTSLQRMSEKISNLRLFKDLLYLEMQF